MTPLQYHIERFIKAKVKILEVYHTKKCIGFTFEDLEDIQLPGGFRLNKEVATQTRFAVHESETGLTTIHYDIT